MVFRIVGDSFQQDCSLGLRKDLDSICDGELLEGEFSEVRSQVADTMSKYLNALRTETQGMIPSWYPPEALEGPIKAVRQRVPDNEALIGEVERFLTALGNLMRESKNDTIH